MNRRCIVVGLLMLTACPTVLYAQDESWSETIVTPQLGCQRKSGGSPVRIRWVKVQAELSESLATTKYKIQIENSSATRQVLDLLIPLPPGAQLKACQSEGKAALAKKVLGDEASRSAWLGAAKQLSNTGVLEFYSHDLLKIPGMAIGAKAAATVVVVYEESLTVRDGVRVDYVLPRSAHNERVPWSFQLTAKSAEKWAAIYSPSHRLKTRSLKGGDAKASSELGASLEPGSVRVSVLFAKGDSLALTVFIEADSPKAGRFLIVGAFPPKEVRTATKSLKREITFVLDRSGSMRGSKLTQAKDAVLRFIQEMEAGERFNVIDYSHSIDSFKGAPVQKTASSVNEAGLYLKGVRAGGGSNISDALNLALAAKPEKNFIPIVFFVTDGVPTLGVCNEWDLLKLARETNQYKHRIFTVGLGVELNSPLLNHLASDSRGESTYVTPGQSMESRMKSVFQRLGEPVFIDPQLDFFERSGEPSKRIHSVHPSRMPDLYENDLFIALGQCRGQKAIDVVVRGHDCGKQRVFRKTLSLLSRSTETHFVSRIWANRQLGTLIHEIRQLGSSQKNSEVKQSKRFNQLVDEAIALSRRYGQLTEYTAFFADDEPDWSQSRVVREVARRNFARKALAIRFGKAAVSQELNVMSRRQQSHLNRKNWVCDKSLNRVALGGVKKLSDKTFYQKADQWIDSELLGRINSVNEQALIRFGSPKYKALLEKLSRSGRHACLSLSGEIHLSFGSQIYRIQSFRLNK